MRMLLTGAHGFLGSAILRQTINSGIPFIATDRFPCKDYVAGEYVAADILDSRSISNIMIDVDRVCHVAGLAHVFDRSQISSQSFQDINVSGTENIARAAAAAGVKYFIFISSVSVYGGVSHGKDELSECHPENPYALSKWEAERILIDFCQKEKINLTILRLATLYGEGDPGNVRRLIRLIDRGQFIWIGRGENLKSLLHREDAARACVSVLLSPSSGIHIYNVAAPPYRMQDIVQKISKNLGIRTPCVHIPSDFALTFTKAIKSISFNHFRLGALHDNIKKWLADDYYTTDKISRIYNFEAKVSLEEGIRREVEWYKAELSKSRIQ